MKITSILYKLEYFYVNYLFPSHERKRKFLIKQGARIGKGTRFNCTTNAFGSEPYLITVGENCLFADETYFITHDGGVKCLNFLQKWGGDRMDKIAPIRVGNNVYTGMRAVIMPGVTIGDNVIIGACAVVTHDIPNNSVALGIPARVVCSLEDYYSRCRNKVEPTPCMPYDRKKSFYLTKFNLK